MNLEVPHGSFMLSEGRETIYLNFCNNWRNQNIWILALVIIQINSVAIGN
jgi:hypothetical protein